MNIQIPQTWFKYTREAIIAVLAVLVIILLNSTCNAKKDRNNLLHQISKYQDGEKAFKTKINKDSSTTVTQIQTILSQKEAVDLKLVQLTGQIKILQSQASQHQNIRIDSSTAYFVPDGFADTTGWYKNMIAGDTTRKIFDSLIKHSVFVPMPYSHHEKWYSLDGFVDKAGVHIDSLKIPNEDTVTIGWKRTGFLWLSKQPLVEIKNSNKLVHVDSVNNVVVKPKEGLFKKPAFWAGIGAGITFLLGHFIK